MIKFVLILAIIIWIPLFIPAVVGWFIPEIDRGGLLGYTIVSLLIWVPVIGAWLDSRK